MKKISYLIISFILLINITACSGYKPIFSSTNLKFEIADYSIVGDKKLGKQIYSKLNIASKANKDSSEVRSIFILINVSKVKKATAKDSAGKILEYKIDLKTNILVKDYLTEDLIIDENFSSSISYKTQNQFSETIKFETRSVNSLLDKIYKEFLIKLTEKFQKT